MLIQYVYSMIYADFQQIWNYKTDPVKIVDFSGFQRPSRLRQTPIDNNWFYALYEDAVDLGLLLASSSSIFILL